MGKLDKLDKRHYNLNAMRKMDKDHFMKAYGNNKLFNAAEIWYDMHPEDRPKRKDGVKSTKDRAK